MANSKFDYHFIQDPDDALKCSICLEVARGQPMQHGTSGCGRLFCIECIEKNGKNPCPMCRGKNPQYFEDAKSLREIKCLGVRCGNVDRGCEWTGTVSTLEDHVAECGYTLVECTNKCTVEGIVTRLMKKDLDNHITTECPSRAYKCEFCEEEGTYYSITGEHDLHCLKKPIPCPNTDCTLTVERGGVEEHVASECEHTIVACKYSNIGCPERKKRKDFKIHERNDGVHLRMSLHTVSQLSNTVVQLSSTVAELNSTVAQLKVITKALACKQNSKTSVSIKICNFKEKKEANEIFYSEPFFTMPNGYKMQLLVYCNGYDDAEGVYLSVYTKLLDAPYNDQLKWPFRGSITVELLSQGGYGGHKEIINYSNEDRNARPGTRLGCRTFIRLSSLVYIAGHTDDQRHIRNPYHGIIHRNLLGHFELEFCSPYLVDNTLNIKVTVQET